MYVKFHAVQLMMRLLAVTPAQTQEAVLGQPAIVGRVMRLLEDTREIVRNEALLLLLLTAYYLLLATYYLLLTTCARPARGGGPRAQRRGVVCSGAAAVAPLCHGRRSGGRPRGAAAHPL